MSETKTVLPFKIPSDKQIDRAIALINELQQTGPPVARGVAHMENGEMKVPLKKVLKQFKSQNICYWDLVYYINSEYQGLYDEIDDRSETVLLIYGYTRNWYSLEMVKAGLLAVIKRTRNKMAAADAIAAVSVFKIELSDNEKRLFSQ